VVAQGTQKLMTNLPKVGNYGIPEFGNFELLVASRLSNLP